jgi:hypothetical protein
MAINKTKKKDDVQADGALPEGAHLNWMGGESYDVKNPISRLRMAASSCFFGEPQYYHEADDAKIAVRLSGRVPSLPSADITHLRETLNAKDPSDWRGLSPAKLMEKAIDEALDHDPEATLREAVRLRNEEYIRTTPQVILVRAAHHPKVRGSGLVGRYASQIVKRADEPAVGLAYQLETYGKSSPIPNSLKKAWKGVIESYKEYDLAKYRMENRVVKTVDVVNLVHAKSDPVSKLMKGELKTSDQTWESIISAGGSTAENWTKALDVMGHMAMLRNVRNLLKKGVDPSLFLEKLVAGAEKGKQLPFRYVSAYNAVKETAPGKVQDAIERCLKLSLGNLPRFPGKVMSLADNSGSAQGAMTSSMGTMPVATIGNLTAILTGMVADDGYAGVFGDELKTMPVRKGSSVFDQLDKLEGLGNTVGGSTENGIWLFWDQAIRTKERWDHVFIYSDMQAGHGGLYGTNPSEYSAFKWSNGRNIDVAKLIKEYRKKVNPNVNVYLVQIAGYQDTIVPEFYDRTYILGGWGDGILRFAAEMSGLKKPDQQQ